MSAHHTPLGHSSVALAGSAPDCHPGQYRVTACQQCPSYRRAISDTKLETLVCGLFRDGVQLAADLRGLGVAGCFLNPLDQLYARGQPELGVDMGEVGLHGAR
jgi:hypothetical protein